MATLSVNTGIHLSMRRVYFSQQAKTNTWNGLSALSVSSTDFSYLNPVLIATAVIYLVILALLAVVSFARSFVEAAHGTTSVRSVRVVGVWGSLSTDKSSGTCSFDSFLRYQKDGPIDPTQNTIDIQSRYKTTL